MALRFYNSMTRTLDEFQPQVPGKVSLYTCGPTVYNYPHIGNLRTFLFEDLLHRWLRYRGLDVTHVMNLTDVDDKTIKNSIREKKSLLEYTALYKKAFFEDLNTLRVRPATHYPAATDYIAQMQKIIEGLFGKGLAYESADGVYFKVSAFKNYGKLAHIERDQLKAGASGRVASDEYTKDEVSDFALWKKWVPEDGDVKWPSPWGEGRPGWHIECSAMSMELLGETIDIHCGGIDNLFPHHENEIAQSEGFTGKTFVNYWLHATHLVVDGEKMSKSKGNFYTLRDLLERGFDPRAIRFALLTTHYRKPLNFTFDLIRQGESALKRLDDFLFALGQVSRETPSNADFKRFFDSTREKIERSLDEDLNISEAMGGVFELVSHFYEHQTEVSKAEAEAVSGYFRTLDDVLGFLKFPAADLLSPEEQKLFDGRNAAKKAKDFKLADDYRDQLLVLGIEVRDTKDGPVWKRL